MRIIFIFKLTKLFIYDIIKTIGLNWMDKMQDETEGKGKESIIKSIMIEQEEKTRGALDPLAVAIGAMGHLRDREREILVGRFGLGGGEKVTLEAVGSKLNVTRERVRQIEAAAIKRLTQKPTKDLTQIIKIINSFMIGNGGLTSLEGLADYFKVEPSRREVGMNALKLIMSANEQVVPLKKMDDLTVGWAKKDFPVDLIVPVIMVLEGILRKADKTMNEQELWNRFNEAEEREKYGNKISPEILKGIVLVASTIAKAYDGKWGLTSWPTVLPRRIRDKIYIILEQTKKPMHFTDITDVLNRNYPGKKVLSRTVHNELIGDPRFILVGRGIYALKDWGYKPGVVADVIKDVLKEQGRPMAVGEIVEEVLKRRQVKSNTVIANLQNTELFKKVSKGVYALSDTK